MNSNNQNLPESQSQIEKNDSSPPESSNAMDYVTPSVSATTGDLPEFGWSAYAERMNGRFAMLGFLSLLIIEALSNDSFLHWAGLIK